MGQFFPKYLNLWTKTKVLKVLLMHPMAIKCCVSLDGQCVDIGYTSV